MHGDKTQAAREKALARFEAGKVTTLIATDVAARGLDLDDITHVINFDPPEDEKAYTHRVGRTGRAGRSGTGITLVLPGPAGRREPRCPPQRPARQVGGDRDDGRRPRPQARLQVGPSGLGARSGACPENGTVDGTRHVPRAGRGAPMYGIFAPRTQHRGA